MGMFSDIGTGLLKSVAPTIATALGGPLAGMAVGFVAKKLLNKPDASADEIAKLVTSMKNPEDLQKLKDAENEFTEHMAKLGVDVFKLEVDDRKSARDFGTKSTIGGLIQAALATIIMGGFFYTVWKVLSGTMTLADPNMAMTVGTIIGYVSAKADQVVAFFFGSSQGSKDKTEQLSQAIKSQVK